MSFIRSGSFIHYSPKYFSVSDSSFPKTVFIYKLICVMSHRSLECCLHFPINFFFVLNAFFSLSHSLFLSSYLLSLSTEISLQNMFNWLFPNSLWLTFQIHGSSLWFHMAVVPPWVPWRSHFAMFQANSTSEADKPVPTDFSHRPWFASLSVFNFLGEYCAF